MARGFEYYWNLLQWTLHHYRPGERDVTVETENGLLSINNKDWLMGKHLFVRRNYELGFIRDSIAFLQDENLLKSGKNRTVVDVGANLGMICIALLREDFFEKAIAFEPSPRNFRLLEKNVSQNHLNGKIECHQLALSSVDGEIEFEIDITNSGDSRVRKTLPGEKRGDLKEHKRQTVSVEAKTFDSFLSQNLVVNSEEIDLFWIDIQGHEGHFFKGARDLFKQNKIPVVNEFWGYGINRSGMTREEYCLVLGETFSGFYHLTENGYRLKSISEIEKLFDIYEKATEVGNIILI